MSGPDGALWAFFLTGALTVAVAIVAMGAFVVLAQRRTLALHRRYAQELLQAQERERAWVAREVHDDAVQHLAAIANELKDILPAAVPSLPAQRIDGMVGEVRDLAESLRKLAHGLHPSMLDKGGAVPALQQLAGMMRSSHDFEVHLDIPDQPLGLPRELELCLFRVAQEAVRNVSRHAGVSEAWVRLTRRPGAVVLEVTDHGTGLPADARPAAGIGLMSMKERARLAGGTLSVGSRPGAGTTIQLTIPTPGAQSG